MRSRREVQVARREVRSVKGRWCAIIARTSSGRESKVMLGRPAGTFSPIFHSRHRKGSYTKNCAKCVLSKRAGDGGGGGTKL